MAGRPSPFAAARLGREADVGYLRRGLASGELAPNAREEGRRGETCLCKAAGAGAAGAAEALLAGGAHPDVRSLAGDAPLHLAAARGSEACVDLLLGRGCNHRAEDRGRRTALHLAAFRGRRKVVALLLEHDAAVRRGERSLQPVPRGPTAREAVTYCEERDSLGFTALHLAAKQGHVEIVRDLLEAGARADVRSSRSGWALHDAVRSGSSLTVAALMRGGARPEERDDRGRLPCDLAGGTDQVMLQVLGGDLSAAENRGPAPAPAPRAAPSAPRAETSVAGGTSESGTCGGHATPAGAGEDWKPFQYGRRAIADSMSFDF